MRLLVVFLFIASSIRSQHTVTLKISEKETAHGFSFWNKLSINSKDTSFVLTLHPLPSNVFLLKSKGEYTFRFYSVFGDVITRKITISLGQTCVNISDLTKNFKKESSAKSYLKNIKLKDTVVLIHSYLSNEATSKKLPEYDKLMFTKVSETEVIAIQFKNSGSEIVQQISLTAKQFNELVTSFENKARTLQKKQGCETKEVYTLKTKKKYYSVVDASCGWKGYEGLLAGLFIAIRP